MFKRVCLSTRRFSKCCMNGSFEDEDSNYLTLQSLYKVDKMGQSSAKEQISRHSEVNIFVAILRRWLQGHPKIARAWVSVLHATSWSREEDKARPLIGSLERRAGTFLSESWRNEHVRWAWVEDEEWSKSANASRQHCWHEYEWKRAREDGGAQVILITCSEISPLAASQEVLNKAPIFLQEGNQQVTW